MTLPVATAKPTSFSVHLTTPLPVRVTGTALPVKVTNKTPFQVENVGPPDTIAVLTLAAAVATLAASIGAFGYNIRATYLAKRDFVLTQLAYDLTKEQAKKADKERERVPELLLVAVNAQNNEVASLIVDTERNPAAFVASFRLKNTGKTTATGLSIKLRMSAGLEVAYRDVTPGFQALDAEQGESFVELQNLHINPSEKPILNNWLFGGEVGEYPIRWQVTGNEGAWPCERAEPADHWGQIPVVIRWRQPALPENVAR